MFLSNSTYFSIGLLNVKIFSLHSLFLAKNFGKTIGELESTHAALATTLASNKMMLQKVQETFVTNLESVNLEKDKLEGRIKAAETK